MFRRLWIGKILVVVLFAGSISGELIPGPSNVEAVRGSNTTLTCITSFGPDQHVNWLHIPVGSTSPTEVYYNDLNIRPYFPRFRVSKDKERGHYNLTISSIEPSDAGKYICVDKSGSGEERSAELVVLDSVPIVRSNVSLDNLTICKTEVHYIKLTCSVTYKGNIDTKLYWAKTTSAGVTVNYNHTRAHSTTSEVTTTAAVVADYTWDGSSFSCLTSAKISSALAKIHVEYAVSVDGDLQNIYSSFCQVKANVPCLYRILSDKDTQNGHGFDPSASNSNRSYSKLCEFKCGLSDRKCLIYEPYYEIEDTGSSNSTYALIGVVVLLIIIIIIIVIYIVLIIYMKRKKEKKKRQHLLSVQEKAEQQHSRAAEALCKSSQKIRQEKAQEAVIYT